MYYNEILEKDEQNKWHIVSNKPKEKKNKYGGQFVPTHFVRDSKFNAMCSDFVKVFLSEEEANEGINLEPVEILRQLGTFDARYQAKCEQDAEELLILMLDLLSQG